MKFEEVEKYLRGIPHTPSDDGRILYEFVLQNKVTNVLELGFQHGVSSNYLAAALDEIGKGKILTIDREITRSESPSIYDLSKQTGLERYIEVVFARNTYIWELRKLIKYNYENPLKKRTFDFCFIDGAHNFETDGFAFYLVDLLLDEGGVILFDDINWSYHNSPTLKETDFVKQMAVDEREAEQIRDVIELLVYPNNNYELIEIKNRWAWFRKKSSTNNEIDLTELYKNQKVSLQLKNILKSILKK